MLTFHTTGVCYLSEWLELVSFHSHRFRRFPALPPPEEWEWAFLWEAKKIQHTLRGAFAGVDIKAVLQLVMSVQMNIINCRDWVTPFSRSGRAEVKDVSQGLVLWGRCKCQMQTLWRFSYVNTWALTEFILCRTNRCITSSSVSQNMLALWMQMKIKCPVFIHAFKSTLLRNITIWCLDKWARITEHLTN